jgi:hypothetical protein
VGSIPNVTLTWIHIGCFTARLRLPKNDKHRCSVGRAHDSYYAFLFFFFLFAFRVSSYTPRCQILDLIGELGPRYVPERGTRHEGDFFVWSAWKTRVQPRRLYE